MLALQLGREPNRLIDRSYEWQIGHMNGINPSNDKRSHTIPHNRTWASSCPLGARSSGAANVAARRGGSRRSAPPHAGRCGVSAGSPSAAPMA